MRDLVRFIFTGDAEAAHLARALNRRYPDANFETCERASSFTSLNLEGVPPRLAWATEPETRACTLASRLISELVEHPQALIVVVDDIELVNAKYESAVTSHFAAAIELVLSEKTSSRTTRERYRDALRTRASLHLLRPMLEAYFFTDGAALAAMNVETLRNRFDPRCCDVEEFEVTDADFESPAVMFGKKRFPHAWAKENRRRHPKHYVRYLLAPTDPTGRLQPYSETLHGGVALDALDWSVAMSAPERVPFLRAFFDDLDEWLDRTRTLTVPASVPTRRIDGGILRNVVSASHS